MEGPKVNFATSINKSEMLIGSVVGQDIVDQRGVLLLRSGTTITDNIKSRLYKWGKVFFQNNIKGGLS